MAGRRETSRKRFSWMSQFLWEPQVARVRRRVEALGPLGLALTLVVGAVWLLGAGGANARSSGPASGSGHPGGQRSAVTGRIARADAHVEMTVGGKDVELNVALTQTQSDCQAPVTAMNAVNGGVCLRYSVVVDEQGVLAGYGVIPASDVTVTPGVIALRVDTAQVLGFTQVVGARPVIVVTWQALAGTTSGMLQRASAQGSVGAYAIPRPSASASVIATMLLR